MGTIQRTLAAWSRRYSLRPIIYGTPCCTDELEAAQGPTFDDGRSGLLPQVADPSRADLLIVAGRLSLQSIPHLQRCYHAMAPPRWVMAFGSCAVSGGLFDTYAMGQGADACLPPDVHVDVHVPGCPPHPEDLYDALEVLGQRLRSGVSS